MLQIRSDKIRWAISAVLAALILLGTYRSVFSLAAFLICGFMIVFCDHESTLLQLFFVMPMANIFRITPTTQSFLTILMLLYVVFHLVLPRKATLLVVLFAAYVVIGELVGGEFNLFKTIKLICNILLLSSILNSEVKIRHKEIFLSYIIGNIVASFFKLADSSVFKISSYINTESIGNINFDNFVVRFSGLYSDPNYYAVGMIISLCLLIVLYHRKEIKFYFAALLAVPIVYFLIQTYSKSAALMLVVSAIFLWYTFVRKRNYSAAIILTVLSFAVVVLAFSGKIPFLQTVVDRFMASDSADGMDVSSLTTGRFDLWVTYIKYLIQNIAVGIFGGSITAELIAHHGSHNTYIEVIYYLGIAGGSLLLLTLRFILSQSVIVKHKKSFLNYSVILCICIMYFFLGELFYFDPPFQIMLAFMVLNLPLYENGESETKKII